MFSYKLQMHQETTDSKRLNRFSFAQYCRNELRHDSTLFKQVVFPMSVNVHFPEC